MPTRVFCDTQVIVFCGLAPERLSPAAANRMQMGWEQNSLACADIVLWEIAMLCKRRRIDPGTTIEEFLHYLEEGLVLTVVPINREIAVLAQADLFQHGDPADRLIAATALYYRAPLVTSDTKLRAIPELETIW